MQNGINFLILLISSTVLISSCVKIQKCECSTNSIAYDQNGSAFNKIETNSYVVKGTKNENKAQCDVIKSNQQQGNTYTTECQLQK